MSVPHVTPEKPSAQLHVNDPSELTHVPPFWHSDEPPDAVHSFTSTSQFLPLQPALHAHV